MGKRSHGSSLKGALLPINQKRKKEPRDKCNLIYRKDEFKFSSQKEIAWILSWREKDRQASEELNNLFSDAPQTTPIMFTHVNTNVPGSPVADTILTDFDSKKDLYDIIKSPGYQSYLKQIKIIEVIQCGRYGEIYSDINGHEGFKPHHCNDIDSCIICSTNYTHKQAGDTFELFKEISDKWHSSEGYYLDFWADVFTFPQELQSRLKELGAEGDKLVRKAVNRFYRIAFGGMSASLLNHQDWHSDDPLGEPYRHVHADSINLFYRNISLEDIVDAMSFKSKARFFVVDSYITDLDEKRAIWRDQIKWLASKLGIQLSSDILNNEKEVNWHHRYIPIDPFNYRDSDKKNYNMIKHELNYDMRKPIADIVKFFECVAMYDWQLSNRQKDRLNELLTPEKGIKYHQWVGWLADGVKNKYLHLLDLHVKSKKELQQEIEDSGDSEEIYICPICGEHMHKKSDELIFLDKLPDNTLILKVSNLLGYSRHKRIVHLI